MALDIENKIETAWVTLLEANAYIIANSIPVRRFNDNSEETTDSMVVVRVNPVAEEFANSTLWDSNVEIMAATFIADDLDQSKLEPIYKECLAIAKDSTTAALTTAGSITFNGTTMIEPGAQLFDDKDRYQSYIINIQCHVQT